MMMFMWGRVLESFRLCGKLVHVRTTEEAVPRIGGTSRPGTYTTAVNANM